MLVRQTFVMTEPVFGERLRGKYASEANPIRDGYYVRTIVHAGRLNPGKFYELTDRRGKFWRYPADSVLFLDRQADKAGGSHSD